MQEIATLAAEAQWFSSHAKDLLVAGKPFRFVVTGLQATEMRPFMDGANLREVTRMGLNLRLQPLLAVILMSQGMGRQIRFEVHGDEITGSVPGTSTSTSIE